MSSEQTRRVMGEYFEAVGAGDCARFFTHDICWTTIETGAQVHGPQAVQNAILGLHANMTDIRTRQLVVSESSAYIEGSCRPLTAGSGPVSYCVAYDLADAQIKSMRAYGSLASMMPQAATG